MTNNTHRPGRRSRNRLLNHHDVNTVISRYVYDYQRWLIDNTATHHQCVNCGVWHQRILECPWCLHQITEKEREQINTSPRRS